MLGECEQGHERCVSNLIYGMIMSLDGCIKGEHGDFRCGAPTWRGHIVPSATQR